ncbi:unnamed protein product [Prunus brigantina]
MSNLKRVLERQHREDEEIRRRHAEEDCKLDEEEEEVVLVVGMLNQSRQHHRGRAPNVDRHRHSRGKNLLEDYFIPNSLYPITYQINNTVHSGVYYLTDGIYLRWTTFIKTILNPQLEKEKSFAALQEGYMKDVEMCFGILQAR